MSCPACGAILEVDLTLRTAVRTPTPEPYLRDYLGGRALGIRLLWSLEPGTAADDPETPLIFCPGLLNGYPSPGTPRSAVVTKSPLTRPLEPRFDGSSTVSYSNLGGYFGTELKYAGVDALVIRGQSEEPVLLVIDGDEVRFEDASNLWGRTSPETDTALRERLEDERFQTVYIGPAGENGVRYASIIHEVSRAFARGGVGYVMGAKKLKAIAVRGSRIPGAATPADYRTAMDELRQHFREKETDWAFRAKRTAGSLNSFGWACAGESLAVRNFREGSWSVMSDYARRAARYFVHQHTCYACPVSCRLSARVPEGPTAGRYAEAAHFEHAAMLGANCGLSDEKIIPMLSERCNEFGMDIITLGNIFGFLMDMRERGRLPEGFLGDIDLDWGNWRAMNTLIEHVARRTGPGEVISRGLVAVVRELGHGTGVFAFEAKGHEYPGWNAKGSCGMALSYATATRGACHLTGMTVAGQNRQAMNDSVGSCYFVRRITHYALLARLVSAVVGETYGSRDLYRVGERAMNLEKCFNWREGFTARDDRRVPAALAREPVPSREGPDPTFTDGRFQASLTSYYRNRGWDEETSKPTRRRLEQLRLTFAADAIEET